MPRANVGAGFRAEGCEAAADRRAQAFQHRRQDMIVAQAQRFRPPAPAPACAGCQGATRAARPSPDRRPEPRSPARVRRAPRSSRRLPEPVRRHRQAPVPGPDRAAPAGRRRRRARCGDGGGRRRRASRWSQPRPPARFPRPPRQWLYASLRICMGRGNLVMARRRSGAQRGERRRSHPLPALLDCRAPAALAMTLP